MLEKDIEAYLVRRVKGAGGVAYKFTSPQHVSVPDRMVLVPEQYQTDSNGKKRFVAEARTVFVECKRPGATATIAQKHEHSKLLVMGFSVYIVNDHDSVDRFINAEFGK